MFFAHVIMINNRFLVKMRPETGGLNKLCLNNEKTRYAFTNEMGFKLLLKLFK